MASSLTFDDRGLVVPCPQCGQKNRIPFERLSETVRCGKCKTEIPPPAAPVDVTSEAIFDRLVSASPLPIVVDYWAEWCGPCRMVAPELAKVAQQNAGRLVVVKVNTEELPGLAQRFRIQSIPMMSVFNGGREVGQTVGARPARDIQAFVEQSLRR
ncbi:MAG: thioredoxin [Acidobacteria bacterium]|nr:MAG: thioredoxin [Acidobacteriota bacterium]